MNEIAKITGEVPPAELLPELEASTGRGLSTERADNLVPLMMILQKLSPQVEPSSNNYIPNAKAGDIWLRNNIVQEIVSGQEGILFQPCYFYHDWLEWVPREKGGGFAGRHGAQSHEANGVPLADAKRGVDARNRNRVFYVRPNGNELIQTRNHVGFAILPTGQAFPFIIPMSGSAHTVSRAWMSDMNQRSFNGKRVDSYFLIYRLGTRLRSNQLGSWHTWDINFAGWIQSKPELERAQALFGSFDRQELAAETPEVQDEVPF
jgi:hypothetical protein